MRLCHAVDADSSLQKVFGLSRALLRRQVKTMLQAGGIYEPKIVKSDSVMPTTPVVVAPTQTGTEKRVRDFLPPERLYVFDIPTIIADVHETASNQDPYTDLRTPKKFGIRLYPAEGSRIIIPPGFYIRATYLDSVMRDATRSDKFLSDESRIRTRIVDPLTKIAILQYMRTKVDLVVPFNEAHSDTSIEDLAIGYRLLTYDPSQPENMITHILKPFGQPVSLEDFYRALNNINYIEKLENSRDNFLLLANPESIPLALGVIIKPFYQAVDRLLTLARGQSTSGFRAEDIPNILAYFEGFEGTTWKIPAGYRIPEFILREVFCAEPNQTLFIGMSDVIEILELFHRHNSPSATTLMKCKFHSELSLYCAALAIKILEGGYAPSKISSVTTYLGSPFETDYGIPEMHIVVANIGLSNAIAWNHKSGIKQTTTTLRRCITALHERHSKILAAQRVARQTAKVSVKS